MNGQQAAVRVPPSPTGECSPTLLVGDFEFFCCDILSFSANLLVSLNEKKTDWILIQ